MEKKFTIGLTVINITDMIFDYFFLKFYNGIMRNSIGVPRFYASLVFGCIINVNILIIDTLLAKLDILPSLYDNTLIGTGLVVLTALFFFRYTKSRMEAITAKFAEDDFQPKKKELNIMFVLFIVFTVLSAFIIPLYKPGYLPKW